MSLIGGGGDGLVEATVIVASNDSLLARDEIWTR